MSTEARVLAEVFHLLRFEWVEYLANRGLAGSTIESYNRELELWAVHLERELTPYDSINSDFVEGWITKVRKEERKIATIARKLAVLRGFYKWLKKKKGAIMANPFEDMEGMKREKPVPEFLEVEEVGRLIEAAAAGLTKRRQHVKRNVAMLEVLYGTGCRASELCGMDLVDVSLTQGWVKIRKGKGKKQRIVPLGGSAVAAIKAYLPDREIQLARNATPFEPALFLSQRGRLTRSGVKDFFALLRDRAGVPGKRLYAHLMRHTFATHMHNAGVDILDLQKLLGHDRLETTEVYTHVATSRLMKIHEKAHPRAKSPAPGPRETPGGPQE